MVEHMTDMQSSRVKIRLLPRGDFTVPWAALWGAAEKQKRHKEPLKIYRKTTIVSRPLVPALFTPPTGAVKYSTCSALTFFVPSPYASPPGFPLSITVQEKVSASVFNIATQAAAAAVNSLTNFGMKCAESYHSVYGKWRNIVWRGK
jgi:hypothetical protein